MKNAEKKQTPSCLPAFHDLKTKIGKEMGSVSTYRHEVTDNVF